MASNYKGFALFFEISDEELRSRNQAAVIANIWEDNSQDKKLSKLGFNLITSYYAEIAPQFRGKVKDKLEKILAERGYVKRH